jgi:hypothetical protein
MALNIALLNVINLAGEASAPEKPNPSNDKLPADVLTEDDFRSF